MKAVLKTKTYSFQQKDLEDVEKCREAATYVIIRVIRGFLGRRKFHQKLTMRNKELQRLNQAAIRIQSLIRRYLICCRYYDKIGTRYRLWKLKQKKYLDYINHTTTTTLTKPLIPFATYVIENAVVEEVVEREEGTKDNENTTSSPSGKKNISNNLLTSSNHC